MQGHTYPRIEGILCLTTLWSFCGEMLQTCGFRAWVSRTAGTRSLDQDSQSRGRGILGLQTRWDVVTTSDLPTEFCTTRGMCTPELKSWRTAPQSALPLLISWGSGPWQPLLRAPFGFRNMNATLICFRCLGTFWVFPTPTAWEKIA